MGKYSKTTEVIQLSEWNMGGGSMNRQVIQEEQIVGYSSSLTQRMERSLIIRFL